MKPRKTSVIEIASRPDRAFPLHRKMSLEDAMRSIQPSTRSQSGGKAIDLANDFQNVVSDAQELLKTMGDEGDAKLIEVKKRFQTSLNLARQRFGEVQATVTDSMKAAAKTTDDYV